MKFLITLLALAATTALALPADVAIPPPHLASRASSAVDNFNFTTDFDGALSSLFDVLDTIPDSVLESGDAALDAWLVANGLREPGAVKRSEDVVLDTRGVDGEMETSLFERAALQARVSWWKVAKCVAAIVQMLATTAVPAAKILRIKKYIKALGGAKQAVKLLLGATSKAEKLKAGGEVLVNLSAELLGISSVKKNCF
jgi:hypothetical protein